MLNRIKQAWRCLFPSNKLSDYPVEVQYDQHYGIRKQASTIASSTNRIHFTMYYAKNGLVLEYTPVWMNQNEDPQTQLFILDRDNLGRDIENIITVEILNK